MISEIVDPPEQLRDEAQELAETIAQNSPGRDAGHEEGARGARSRWASPTPARPAPRSSSRCGATPTRPRARSPSPRSATPNWQPLDESDVVNAMRGATGERGAGRSAVRRGAGHRRAGGARRRSGPRRSASCGRAPTRWPRRCAAAGVGDGRAVVVMLPNRADLVATLFGVWRAGGVYVPLNPRLTEREVEHVLESVRPVAARHHLGPARRGSPRLPTVVLDAGTPPSVVDRVHAAPPPRSTRHGPHPVHVGHDGPPEAGAAHPRRRARAARRRDRHRPRQGTDKDGDDAPKRPPMPNLIPVSLSLWAGIYQVLFAFRVGAPIIVMDRFDPASFADAGPRAPDPLHRPAAGGDDDAVRRPDRHRPRPAQVRPQHHRAAVPAAGPPVPRPVRPRRPQRLRPDRDRWRDRRLERPGHEGVGRHQAGLGRPSPPGRAGSSGRRGRRHAAARRGRRAVGPHARPQRRLRRRQRPRRPAQPRRLVPHRRRRSGRRRRLRVDRGSGVRHDQPRRAQGVPRGGRRGPPAVARRWRRPRWSASPTTGSARCRGRSSSRPTRRPHRADDDLVALARDHLAPYKVPVRFEIIDELPRNEVGKVRAPTSWLAPEASPSPSAPGPSDRRPLGRTIAAPATSRTRTSRRSARPRAHRTCRWDPGPG